MEGMMVSAGFRNASNGASQASPSRRSHSNPSSMGRVDRHSSACAAFESASSSSASIWHTITPPPGAVCRGVASMGLPRGLPRVPSGEDGSWNTAWDVRPARWLHSSDSAWLLFGVRSCLSPDNNNIDDEDDSDDCSSTGASMAPQREQLMLHDDRDGEEETDKEGAAPVEEQYKVIGVLADGRCLFRAIICGGCITSGGEVLDESTQGKCADQLRHQVAQELLKRRDEMEWSVEGDFDAYVQNIQQPWTWGGEMELLMASHVLKTPISVFIINKSSGSLLNIANYGHDYEQDGTNSIKVLFHGYGHYDALEIFDHQ